MKELALNDFLSYRYLSQVQYAPNGKRAAFAVSNSNEEENNYESRLYLWENGEIRQLTSIGKEGRFIWKDDTHILFSAVRSKAEIKRAESGDPFTSFYSLDVTGGEAMPAFTLPVAAHKIKYIGNDNFIFMAGIDSTTPDFYKMTKEERQKFLEEKKSNADYEVLDEIPFYMNGGSFINKQRTALFLYNGESCNRITDAMLMVEGFNVKDDEIFYYGEAYETKLELTSKIYKYNILTGENICLNENPGSVSALEFVGDQILVVSTVSEKHGMNENAKIFTMDASGVLTMIRDEQESMYNSVGSDCRYGGGEGSGVYQGAVYHITTRWGNAPIYKLSMDGTSVPVLEKEGAVDCLAVNENAELFLMVAMFDQKLQELYSFNPKNGEIKQESSFNEECLKDVYVAVPKRMVMQSCGYEIEGWVMEPKDYDPQKKYPAVLDIHGGPKTVYGSIFYHEMQLWANRGYFVFFCNPKGSDGRGNEFMDIRGEYGHTDYQNIMDFTDRVLEMYPQIDASKVAVTGGSYGGFMTNWVIGHTDRFACAASQRSISNWISFYGVSDIGYFFAADQCNSNIYDSPEKMWELSPLRYAKNVKTPTLFIHSDEDYRCPMAEGLQMYTALVEQGIPSRLCYFKGENHELSRSGKPKHRIRRLQEITDWIEKYTK